MSGGSFEVVIVGGGAAGVAAGRRLRDAGIEALIVEARPRLGGRAWTIEDSSGFALDLGCGWLHSADRNPWREIAEAKGFGVDRARPPWTKFWPQKGFSLADHEDFVEALMRYRRKAESTGENEPDRAAATALEPQGRWNALIDAVSTYYSGAELDRVSLRDLARYEDTGVNWRVVEGYGRVVEAYGEGLAAELDCAVLRIDRSGKLLSIETTKGAIAADAAIIALPSALIAERAELFRPALPDKTAAAAGLPLGVADKLFLTLAAPEQFESDSRCFGRTDRAETGAYNFRPLGRPMIEAFFGGTLAADLEAGGQCAFLDFAVSELVGLFGRQFGSRLKPIAWHGWRNDPLSRGSYSYALPGMADCRGVLAAPVEDRLFFAGEACSPSDFSTAHGAYLTGLAAADQATKALRPGKGALTQQAAQA